jgi:hypothetical protein
MSNSQWPNTAVERTGSVRHGCCLRSIRAFAPLSLTSFSLGLYTSPVKTVIAILLLIVSAPLYSAPINSATDFVGLAQGDRTLADIGTDSELRVVTVLRAPELRASPFPERISIVYLTRKPGNSKQWHAHFPEGTEFKLHLTRRSDATYETIYYRDETQPPKLY